MRKRILQRPTTFRLRNAQTNLPVLRRIHKACKDMGIGPADFASGYIAACAMNLYICFPKEGKERIVAAIFGKLLEEELLRNWEVKP